MMDSDKWLYAETKLELQKAMNAVKRLECELKEMTRKFEAAKEEVAAEATLRCELLLKHDELVESIDSLADDVWGHDHRGDAFADRIRALIASKVVRTTPTLTERLAQAEQRAAEFVEATRLTSLRAEQAERERDEWRKEAKELLSAGSLAVAERDAALTKAETWRHTHRESLAMYHDLRASIEALANAVENHRYADSETAKSVAPKIRALIAPKVETALDVCSKIERMAREAGDQGIEAEAGKLRKLLEISDAQ